MSTTIMDNSNNDVAPTTFISGFISGKRMIKHIMNIPQRTKLSNKDSQSMGRFIMGVMEGSGYEVKCWVQDYLPFRGHFNPDWPTEYSKFMEWKAAGRTVWVAFDKEKGKHYFEHLQSPSGITYSKEVCC